MFRVNSITSWSRYEAQLNSAQSRLRLQQEREDITVTVSRPGERSLAAKENLIIVEFLDGVADAALTLQLKTDTAFRLSDKLAALLHNELIAVGNDDQYEAVDE
tara:strand:- start:350 stop:661 length:312 start_codon:yes stop_codon:yes gene_type:complete